MKMLSNLCTYFMNASPLGRGACAALLAAGLLSACANPKLRAPVEERAVSSATSRSAPSTESLAPVSGATLLPLEATPTRPASGVENAGKPGYYTVKPGETLIRVGLETGQNWKDIAKWNNIDNTNVIEVGQVLRVVPPGTDMSTLAPGARPVATAKVEARPLEPIKPIKPSAPSVVAPPLPMPPPVPPAAPTPEPP